MSDFSDDGYLPGESFFANTINYSQHNNNDGNKKEEFEEYKYVYNDDDNYAYNYLGEENNFIKNHYNIIPKYFNKNYEEEKYYNDSNYYNEMDHYNTSYFNNCECYKKKKYLSKKRNNFNTDNQHNKKKIKIYKTEDDYLSSFAMEFKHWLINELCMDKKNITFDKNKKINKEINDSINKIFKFQKEKEKGSIKMDVKDIELKKIIKGDINLEFKLIINENIDVYFLQKYIEIKIKGEIVYNKNAKFYFQVKQYKITLNENKKQKNDDCCIMNIVNSEEDKYYDVLELDLKTQENEDENEEIKDSDNNEDDKDNVFSNKKKIKMILNELIESI